MHMAPEDQEASDLPSMHMAHSLLHASVVMNLHVCVLHVAGCLSRLCCCISTTGGAPHAWSGMNCTVIYT